MTSTTKPGGFYSYGDAFKAWADQYVCTHGFEGDEKLAAQAGWIAAIEYMRQCGPNDEQVWLEDELMACMQIVAPGVGSSMPDEITYAIMVTAIRRLIECDTDRYEALLARWQMRHDATNGRQE